MINQRLRELYAYHKEALTRIKNEVERQDSTLSFDDGPYLMHSWDELYADAKVKILFVGQESGIGKLTDDIDDLMGRVTYQDPRSPFWKALWDISNALNPGLEDKPCFLVTNVSKYSIDGRRIHHQEDINFILRYLNLLPKEIALAQPDCVVFFTGPEFDEQMQEQFNETLTFKSLHNHIPPKELALVQGKQFSKSMRLYRTYHPNGLQFHRKWEYIQNIIEHIRSGQ